MQFDGPMAIYSSGSMDGSKPATLLVNLLRPNETYVSKTTLNIFSSKQNKSNNIRVCVVNQIILAFNVSDT